MAILRTAKTPFPWIWLWFLSVLLGLYLPRKAICFWKQVVLCVLLLLNSPAPSALPLCPIWVRRNRIHSVWASWGIQALRKVKKAEHICGRWIGWLLSKVPFWQVRMRMAIGLEPGEGQALGLWIWCCLDGQHHPRKHTKEMTTMFGY